MNKVYDKGGSGGENRVSRFKRMKSKANTKEKTRTDTSRFGAKVSAYRQKLLNT